VIAVTVLFARYASGASRTEVLPSSGRLISTGAKAPGVNENRPARV
jgi:hypothetical protein